MANKYFALAIFIFLISPFAYCQIYYEDESSYSNDNGYYDSQPYEYSQDNSGAYESMDYNVDYSSSFSDEKRHRPHKRSSTEDYEEYPIDSYEEDTEFAAARPSRSGLLPQTIPAHGEKVIIIDPKVHAWGAYTAEGKLVRSGLASAGAKWCRDRGRPCRTSVGSFRIFSLGSEDCVSSIYPLEDGGGAPMPYCMFFHGNQGLHGSNHVTAGNISHGCVRVNVSDAKWIRFNFANVGTKVVVKPYN